MPVKDINRFFIAGINYKKSDAAVRGQFAINKDQYISILQLASSFNISEFFIVSTCNRTEIYGFAEHPNDLVNLLCSQTVGDTDTFLQASYIKKGNDAIEHLFNVGAGLDSQILGDYEIVGQIKQAVKVSKEYGFIGAFIERLINCMLQSSKAIKNKTQLSGGTVSVSFAAVQYIKENIAEIKEKKILLVGTGKIGRNTCKNIVDYLDTNNITLINRTDEKAELMAEELNVHFAPSEKLHHLMLESDVILVATNSAKPVILQSHLEDSRQKLILDLSIPANVEPSVKDLPHVTLVNVDELSKLKDETLQMRMAEVPRAKCIIAQHILEFQEWHLQRKYVPILKTVKGKLASINDCPFYQSFRQVNDGETQPSDEQIQKLVNNFAAKMKQQQNPGCYFLEAINEYIAIGVN